MLTLGAVLFCCVINGYPSGRVCTPLREGALHLIASLLQVAASHRRAP